MKLNFYEKYLKENLKKELEELDLNKAKELLTKEQPDSLSIKGIKILFKKDFLHRTMPYVILVGFICMILSFFIVLQVNFIQGLSLKFNIDLYLNKLVLGFFISVFYVLYFNLKRNQIIKIMLEEKVQELENDIFGYKKINKILTQTI